MTQQQKEILWWIGIGCLVFGILAGLFFGVWSILFGGSTVLPKLLDVAQKGREKKQKIQQDADQALRESEKENILQKESEDRRHRESINKASDEAKQSSPDALRNSILKDLEEP